jgi:hypothetical protein
MHRSNSAVTFGCFNNLLKLSDATVAHWAAVLARCPTATLLLRDRELDTEAAVQGRVRERLARAGVGPERLRLLGGAPHREFLDAYREVDVAPRPAPLLGRLDHLGSAVDGRAGGDLERHDVLLVGNWKGDRLSITHIVCSRCGGGGGLDPAERG